MRLLWQKKRVGFAEHIIEVVKKEEECMEKWIFQSKFVNEDTYKHNGEEVRLISVDGTMASIEFMDGTQAEVYAFEVQNKVVCAMQNRL